MALIKFAALGALGYAGYRFLQKAKRGQKRSDNQDSTFVRDSGPLAMADVPTREWSKTDEESDQSFPASDPPANY